MALWMLVFIYLFPHCKADWRRNTAVQMRIPLRSGTHHTLTTVLDSQRLHQTSPCQFLSALRRQKLQHRHQPRWRLTREWRTNEEAKARRRDPGGESREE